MLVLVVEDDKNINEVVSEYLKAAGFNVIASGCGRAAKALIEQNEAIDLFILDIMLPEISGLELLKTIRNHELHKEKAVVMLTALSDEYTQILSFDGLADDYITKPFSPKVLIKHVEALLRRTVKPANLLQIGGIAVNLDGYEAFEGEDSLPLTLREFELLKVLMKNRGKVLNRQQLLNLAWGYDYFGDERIVDVHIKNLRKKFKSRPILTVKGVGYKFEPERKET